jgi:hypothetical protein
MLSQVQKEWMVTYLTRYLNRAVTRAVPNMPEEWDSRELTRFILDEAQALFGICSEMTPERLEAYNAVRPNIRVDLDLSAVFPNACKTRNIDKA